ncbi:MAG TPA: phosphoribosyltransferase family protein, partial [Candidatus Polarisedimenticolia bacterium]|nr:phosphoribosyltransferase family protein [Candidatus Polarisedimenticolia bacterium]
QTPRSGRLFDPVRAFLGAVLETVLPADCLVCEGILPWRQEGGVCLPCWRRLPWAPRRLSPGGLPPAGGAPQAGAAVVSALEYRDEARRLIHALKFDGFDPLGEPLGRAGAERCAALLDALPPADVVVPVPLHWTRRFRRGFNQAEMLACGVARARGLPCAADLLGRAHRGRRQRGLSQRERRAAFAGVFAAPASARGARVLLVDDVVTTGATIAACAAALEAAGAAPAGAFALARTPRLQRISP